MDNILVLLGGLCAGWCIPQPEFMKPITKVICEKVLSRFHPSGMDRAEHPTAEEEKTEGTEVKDEEVK